VPNNPPIPNDNPQMHSPPSSGGAGRKALFLCLRVRSLGPDVTPDFSIAIRVGLIETPRRDSNATRVQTP